MNSQSNTFRQWWLSLLLLALSGVETARSDQGAGRESGDGWIQLAAQIDRNVTAGSRLLAAAREQVEQADEATRAEFSRIEQAVRTAETRLRRCLKHAETASPDNWDRARALLASNYEAYSQAVSQAERLFTLTPSGRRAPPPR